MNHTQLTTTGQGDTEKHLAAAIGHRLSLPDLSPRLRRYMVALTTGHYNSGTEYDLIPLADLDRLAPLVKAECEPIGKPSAIAAVAMLTGAFPHLDAHDPETYTATLVRVAEKYPAGVVAKAVDDLIMTLKFPPKVSDLVEKCDALMRPLNAAQYRLDDMRQTHAKLAERAEQERQHREELDAFKAAHEGRDPYAERVYQQQRLARAQIKIKALGLVENYVRDQWGDPAPTPDEIAAVEAMPDPEPVAVEPVAEPFADLPKAPETHGFKPIGALAGFVSAAAIAGEAQMSSDVRDEIEAIRRDE